jgi:hypothetical protein
VSALKINSPGVMTVDRITEVVVIAVANVEEIVVASAVVTVEENAVVNEEVSAEGVSVTPANMINITGIVVQATKEGITEEWI